MTPESPAPMTHIAGYRLDRRIGAGGMGVVYAATDTRLGRPVALKLMSSDLAHDGEFSQRFHREAEVLARLESPHIIAIYDHGDHDGTAYIATQLVPGGDLRTLIGRYGAVPPRLAIDICAQLAAALEAAHAAGVVHRDVKPGNVLLHDATAELPHAYLCDFGIARTGGQSLTSAGTVAGTWAYLAPERVRGDSGSEASDIYAVGCLLWEMLTGHPPYTGSDLEMAAGHLRAPVRQAPGRDPFSRRLNAFLARAMAKDPGARHASAEALRADLQALRMIPADDFVAPLGEPAPAPLTSSKKGRPLAAIAVAISLVAGIVTGGIWWLTRPDTDPDPPAHSGATPTAPTAEPRPARADINDDGRSDLLLRAGRRSHILWTALESTGDSFTAQQAERGEQGSSLVAVGDLDGQGARPLVVTPRADQSIVVERPAAGKAPYGRPRLESPDEVFRAILFGDFDGDRRDDIFLRTTNDGVDSYWVATSTGSGFGSFRRWLTRTPGSARIETSRVYAGDWDGDGRVDLAILQADPERAQPFTLEPLQSSGTAFETEGEPYSVPDSTDALDAVRPGDFDGDGNDELGLLAVDDASTFRIVEGLSGSAQMTTWLSIPPGSGWPTTGLDADERFAVGDFDGDGRDDLAYLPEPAAPRTSRQRVLVYRSTGEELSEEQSWGDIACRNWCVDAETVVAGG